jgi:hypothetical protein
MTADPRPEGRVRDPDALKRFALGNSGEPCFSCERRPGTEVHHKTFRSQGGDDAPDNLVWLQPSAVTATTTSTRAAPTVTASRMTGT